MFATLATAAFLASAIVVRADPNPTAPGPGAIFNEGSQCTINWSADSSGTWKTMNIQLMTGDNFNMVPLTTVATVDGTSTTSYSWTCPQVTPNSAIYFYQFTSPASSNTLWTTRFAIADANGNTTPPSQQTQPGTGAKIPWGTGALTNPSQSKPPPTGGATSAANVTGNALTAQSTIASSGFVSSSIGLTASTTSVGSSTSTSGAASGVASTLPAISPMSSAAGSSSTTTNGAASFDARSLQIAAALAAAIGFAALL